MSTTFQREANTALKDAGYRYERTSGNAHEVWVKAGVPDIHVPGTPSGGRDSMMARLRRAIRKGTPLTPPSGQEIDVVKPPKSTEKPLSEKLVALASAAIVKKAAQRVKKRESGFKGRLAADMGYPGEVTAWVRRCIETHGAIPNAELNAAAEQLEINGPELSQARKNAGAGSYWMPGQTSKKAMTDFVGRIPANAKRPGVQHAPLPAKTKLPSDVKLSNLNDPKPEPKVEAPNGNEGRRLEQGGLTEDEHAEAERRMVEGHRRAEAERAAILAERGGTVEAVTGETNGKPRALTGLEAAVELLVQEALAATHALTEDDIRSLEGLQETLRRHASEAQGMVGQITLILKRVSTREQVPA